MIRLEDIKLGVSLTGLESVAATEHELAGPAR
jgi:hypothetical protein